MEDNRCNEHSAIKLAISHISDELKRLEAEVDKMHLELIQTRSSTIPLPVTVAFISFFGVLISVVANVVISITQLVAKAYGLI